MVLGARVSRSSRALPPPVFCQELLQLFDLLRENRDCLNVARWVATGLKIMDVAP